jgi:glycosyltransferase involved in cell wall biosynthesis
LGLSEKDVGCDMMCAGTGGCSGIKKLNDNARLICCKTLLKLASTMISPEMVWKLRRICKDYRIIHIHYPDPMACLALFLSGYKGTVVLHWHSDILKQKNLLRLFIPLQKWLLRRADLIVGTTPVYLRESPYLKAVQHKTVCLPIGINSLRPSAEGVNELKSRYGGRKIIFSIGRLVEYKGFKYLIDAARFLSDDYIVLIGGDGPLREELECRIAERSLSGKVKLLGHVPQDDVANYFGACQLYCLSSIYRTEAFAIVQIEAMSCGKPIVATTISGSGVPWVNKSGYSGLNVEPCNSRELAAAIRGVCENPRRYAQFCRQSRRRFESQFERKEMIDRCLKIYEKVEKGKTQTQRGQQQYDIPVDKKYQTSF